MRAYFGLLDLMIFWPFYLIIFLILHVIVPLIIHLFELIKFPKSKSTSSDDDITTEKS